jgi:hypothetical protein
MKRLFHLGAAFTLAIALFGCSGGPREENIEVKAASDPLNEARSVLERYAAGQALGSEVASFPKMVENVKAANAEHGAIIEKGLADIQRTPANRASLAKSILKKLPPAPK